jgi:hypothetical protein
LPYYKTQMPWLKSMIPKNPRIFIKTNQKFTPMSKFVPEDGLNVKINL